MTNVTTNYLEASEKTPHIIIFAVSTAPVQIVSANGVSRRL